MAYFNITQFHNYLYSHQFNFLFIYITRYLSIQLDIYLYNQIFIYTTKYLSIQLNIHLFNYLSIYTTIYLSIYTTICPSMQLSIHLCSYLFIYTTTYIYIHLFNTYVMFLVDISLPLTWWNPKLVSLENHDFHQNIVLKFTFPFT